MQNPFSGTTAIFSESVPDHIKELFFKNGGRMPNGSTRPMWYIAAGLDDEKFIKQYYAQDLRVMTMEVIHETVKEPTYKANFAVALDQYGDVVPASVVFDLDDPKFSAHNLIRRPQTPPSPFSPRAAEGRFPRPEGDAQKRKRTTGVAEGPSNTPLVSIKVEAASEPTLSRRPRKKMKAALDFTGDDSNSDDEIMESVHASSRYWAERGY
ncbi:hypothetical protein C8F04DRAFT_1161106 [Mycena alexandri]|uniref:Uncharacterized protein n=1 Tax=Mycena alexandri TaxID=1745969 RepID=A0AAD6RXR4_9AGAR|nr:hypothetical protein C8F04DRAFT_1161106 [Mycena alexandri]